MAELVVVYKTLGPDVSRVVGYLRSRNLNPVVLDDAGKMGAYRDQAQEIRIAVPETERDMALGVLAEMEHKDEARLASDVKVARGVVLLIVVILALVALIGLLDRSGKWYLAAWFALVGVVAIALIRSAWRKPKT